jgi:hypothetical protein
MPAVVAGGAKDALQARIDAVQAIVDAANVAVAKVVLAALANLSPVEGVDTNVNSVTP